MHAARCFTSNMPPDNIFVKLDFSNAFNCLHRDLMLERVSELVPELYQFGHLAHSHHSTLQFGNFSISSGRAYSRVIHLKGFFFCRAIHPILRFTASSLTMGFMDDDSLVETLSTASSDADFLRREGAKLAFISISANA